MALSLAGLVFTATAILVAVKLALWMMHVFFVWQPRVGEGSHGPVCEYGCCGDAPHDLPSYPPFGKNGG